MVIKRGCAPPDAQAYKRKLLGLCAARGRDLLFQRHALSLLPNCDWRRGDCIGIFMPDGVAFDAAAVKEAVAEGLRKCLASARFALYPRNRWTGCGRAWDQFLLLEGVHGLASAVWPLWVPSTDIGRPRGEDASKCTPLPNVPIASSQGCPPAPGVGATAQGLWDPSVVYQGVFAPASSNEDPNAHADRGEIAERRRIAGVFFGPTRCPQAS